MTSDSSIATINHSGSGVFNGCSLRPWAQVVRGGGHPDTVSPSSVTPEQNLLFSDQSTVPVMVTEPEPQTAAAVETHPEGSVSGSDGNASGVKKSAWNTPSTNDVVEGVTTSVMGAASWPALSELKSASFSSESESESSDTPITLSQTPLISKPAEKPAKTNASYHSNQKHTHPVRQRFMKQHSGYNRPLPPPPLRMTPFPLFDMSNGSFVPAMFDSSGFPSHRKINSFGPPPHVRGYMPQPHLGRAPFIAPQPMRPYGTPPMGYDMAAPYLYVPTLPPVPPYLPLPVLIVKQIEYYFSDANLVKDNFLKSNMDHEGWVPIALIAGFRRVQSLTTDGHMILSSLRDSSIVEIQGEKVRRRIEWRKWIKPHNNSFIETHSQQVKLDESTSQIHIKV